jgi:transposase
LAKHVFQVHGVDASSATVPAQAAAARSGAGVFRGAAALRGGLEACATAHCWARELQAVGHEVRLTPAPYVKAYVRRNKNDAADAEAICEAVGQAR